MNLTQEFRKIFGAEQTADGVRMIDEEQDVLLDVLLFMRDDVEKGMGKDIIMMWRMKLISIIEYLEMAGKISAALSSRYHLRLIASSSPIIFASRKRRIRL